MVYSVKYNVIDDNAEQMVVLSKKQINKLNDVFWDMNTVTSEIETFTEKKTYTTTDEDGNTVTKTKTITKRIKTIYVDCLSSEEIAAAYHFNKTQLRVLEEMKKSGYGVLLGNNSLNIFLTTEQIAEIKAYMPDDLSIERERVVRSAKSIVGKVNYFWGGKSSSIGLDKRWGKQMEVTSKGSSTTGTIRPFGLDCSGYVTWVFINIGLPVETIDETIGNGTTKQWNVSISIPESLALPGDLAFLAVPGTRKVNHIGIVVGKNAGGKTLVAHCVSGDNNVVVTTSESAGFMYYRRPAVLMK
jgi:cell wall-associated NlpC family hydrolase